MRRIPVPALSFALALLGSTAAAAAPVVIDAEYHHLRNADPREWSSFPEEAEAKSLRVSFDLTAPGEGRLLTLRQEETKQAWIVSINGRALGTLPRDHNHMEHALEILPGILKEEGNILEVSTDSEVPDDIRVGEFAIHPSAVVPGGEARAASLEKRRGFRRVVPEMDAVLRLSAVDGESGEPLPCRFTVTDAETGALVLIGAESDDRLAVRTGVVYTLDGRAEVPVAGGVAEPRRYRISCGRGFEFSLETGEVVVDVDGATATADFRLRREVSTSGLVACDPHLHTYEFDRHGDSTVTELLVALAGEGVEIPVSTAHDRLVPLADEARRIGADSWMTPVLGCEVTTNLGHFNAFPIDAGAEPPAHKLRPWPKIFANIFATPGVEVCVLNHARDVHREFRPLGAENFDAAAGTFVHGRELRANAMELVNSGAQQSDPMQLVRDWFALLRSGHRVAGIGASDSHTVNFAIPGQARTYLEAPDADPSAIDIGAAVRSILSGRTWVSFGLLADLTVEGASGSVTATVSGPAWTRVDRVRLFRNGREIKALPVSASEGGRAGRKFVHECSLADLGAAPGDFLCAVATGPGTTGAFWPVMPPYQATSPDFEPFVMGISPAVWVE